jgi:hypothetical protein
LGARLLVAGTLGGGTVGIEWRWRLGVLIRPVLGLGETLNEAVYDYGDGPSGRVSRSATRSYGGVAAGYAF